MAGAWDWYRAMLRTIHHVGMRGDSSKGGASSSAGNRDLGNRL